MKQYFIQVELLVNQDTIVSTLKRIGILTNKRLTASCQLFTYNKKNYIVHFKEMFSLFDFVESGSVNEMKIKMSEEDFLRRNNIIKQLIIYGMIKNIDIETNDSVRFDIADKYVETINKVNMEK